MTRSSVNDRHAVGLRVWFQGDVIGVIEPSVAGSGSEVDRDLKQHVEAGGVLAIPTESSYGLAADPRNRSAVERIYRLKGRGADQPLPIVAADVDQIRDLGCLFGDEAVTSTRFALWPAPLSIVLPLAPGSERLPAAAGGDSVAVRIPDHEPLRSLLTVLGTALTATSANASGQPAILDPAELRQWLAAVPEGSEVMIIEGGRLPGGPPSTLVRSRGEGYEILRRGAFPEDRLARAWHGVGKPLEGQDSLEGWGGGDETQRGETTNQ